MGIPLSPVILRGMASFASVLARNLAAERHRLGWRQRDLAERLGWPPVRVSEIETGRRPIRVEELAPVCEALSITLADLGHGADERELQALGIR